jgi:hypothetical protein
MAGTITANTIQSDTTSPPEFRNSTVEIGQLCRAWVNFNGNGGAIRSFFNVSSITVNGTGDYRINYTNAFASANYSFVSSCSGNGGTNTGSATPLDQTDLLTTSTRIVTRGVGPSSTVVTNPSFVSASVFSS